MERLLFRRVVDKIAWHVSAAWTRALTCLLFLGVVGSFTALAAKGVPSPHKDSHAAANATPSFSSRDSNTWAVICTVQSKRVRETMIVFRDKLTYFSSIRHEKLVKRHRIVVSGVTQHSPRTSQLEHSTRSLAQGGAYDICNRPTQAQKIYTARVVHQRQSLFSKLCEGADG